MVSLAATRLTVARALIASACLDALPDPMLGRVRLRDEQRVTLARAQRAVHRYGGCLIGEDVGHGKTFVALALARTWGRPLVVVPATLRSTWRLACERAEVSCALHSHEALSRGSMPTDPCDGIIVDESHHFRTPTTRRYAALTRLSATAPIALLSATPLQNRARDLAAQVALFFGERAFSLDLEALSRFVIRSGDGDPALPTVRAPEWLPVRADDDAVLRAIVSAGTRARPVDGGDSGVLRMIGLVRAWASSRAALESTLRTRRSLVIAIEQGLDAGRVPTRSETRAWQDVDGAIQLGFPAMLMRSGIAAESVDRLRADVLDDQGSIDRIQKALLESPDPDWARIESLRALRGRYPGTRIVAFSEFASTVSSCFAAMRTDAGVGLLTSTEARIASGRLTRDEVLARFAPVAQGANPPRAHESITLLLATDLLSEGVNLQDAAIVVHLDLPWNPARLAQRLGRIRRPGGAIEVRSFLMAPPASAALLLSIDARLRHKLKMARQFVGEGLHVLPDLPPLSRKAALFAATSSLQTHPEDGNAETEGAFFRQLARWRLSVPSRLTPELRHCVVAGLAAGSTGWLAALSDGQVVCSDRGRSSTSPVIIRQLAEVAGAGAWRVAVAERRAIHGEIDRWIAGEQLSLASGLGAREGPIVRQVTQWIDEVGRTLPRHRRAEGLAFASRVRDALATPCPLGVQQMIADRVAEAGRDSDQRLAALTMAASVVDAYQSWRGPVTRRAPRAVAVIVFGPRGRRLATPAVELPASHSAAEAPNGR